MRVHIDSLKATLVRFLKIAFSRSSSCWVLPGVRKSNNVNITGNNIATYRIGGRRFLCGRGFLRGSGLFSSIIGCGSGVLVSSHSSTLDGVGTVICSGWELWKRFIRDTCTMSFLPLPPFSLTS